MKHFKLLITGLLLISAIVGCKETLVFDQVEIFEPIVTEMTPIEGRRGTDVTILGENLKEVDSVTIGGVPALIKYRINSTNMVVTVTADCRTGELIAYNSVGESTAPSIFTVLYPTPQIDAYPVEGFAYDKIIIEGQDLDLVTQVHFDTIAAEISYQQENLIEVVVPFVKDLSAAITLTFPTAEGEGTQTLENEFTIEIEDPVVNYCPTEAFDSTEIIITGENLYSIESVIFGTVEGSILEQGDTSLTVLVPPVSAVTSTVELSLHYYGQQIVAQPEFQVQVATLAFWEDMKIYSATKDGMPTEDSVFFDGISGKAYSPCEWEEKKEKVHFFITMNNDKVRITAQDNAGTAISNFSCSGTQLPEEGTPNTMRLKRLNSSDTDENDLITKVKNHTLEELNSAILEELGIGNASQSYLEEDHFLFNFAAGDVILFQQFNDALTEVQYTGAFEVIELNKSNGDTEASMTFNAYFGAY